MNFFDGVEGFGIQELLERVGSGNEGEFMEVRWSFACSALASQHAAVVLVQCKTCPPLWFAAAGARFTLATLDSTKSFAMH